MISDQVLDQIRGGEDVNTELVVSPLDGERIAQTVCAFLNTQGGTIFCGVDDNGTIVGVDHPNKLVEKLNLELQKRITPKALFTVNSDAHGEINIISINVPEGKDRPYVSSGGVFIRQGASTIPADAVALRRMIQFKSVETERWERRPSMGMDEEDLDHQELQETAIAAQEFSRFKFPYGNDDIDILRALGLYSSHGFTQAADILFSQNPDQRHPQVRVRVTRFDSDKLGSKFIDNRTFQGPLVRIFKEVFDTLTQHVRVESNFRSGKFQREDRPAYPFDALREGLVNSFAHRDYASFSGGILVSIYPSRVEIWNSGRLPEGLKPGDLKRNHPSLPTNPDIAHVFHIRGLMERIGRGTQKIISSCIDAGLPTPKWDDRPSGVTLVIYSRSTESGGDFSPNMRQLAFLEEFILGETIKPSEYHTRFADGLSERQSRRDLVDLENEGFLIRMGGGAGTFYLRSSRRWTGETDTNRT